MTMIEHASASGDPGANILRRSMKAGSKSLDLPMLAAINKSRKAIGLDPVLPPAGCKLHRTLQVISEARALVARIDSERR
jgi:hypothetical protein